jgi:diadenosine tetraphosphatase ApaH/serine/threonine PP2A family protein phosphatase
MDSLIIGDIHGHLESLEALLTKAGFAISRGVWRNRDCRAVFVGDLIDRGPHQLEVIDLVRHMIDAGAAEMCLGNHEFNAIAYATEDRDAAALGTRKHYRIRNHNNRAHHEVFLHAVGEDSPLHKEVIAWFASLPMWLEFEDFNVVHACWHRPHQALLAPHLDRNNVMTTEGLHTVFRKGTSAYDAAEILLKGPEIRLPDLVSFFDNDGTERFKTRIRWWNEGIETYRSAALVDDEIALQIQDDPLPASSRVDLDDEKPLFFGHYWMDGQPRLISDMRTCLDFSIAKDGVLAGYLMRDGERVLTEQNLLWVGNAPNELINLTA